MRYRRLSYRYAVVMAAGRPRPLAELWQRQATSIGPAQTAWRPPTDVVETATEVVVLVELPGVDHEQLDVLLYEDALIVEGERRLPSPAAGTYHAAEIRQGQVRLEAPLPAPIDPEQVDARYERGLLEMRLVKRTANPRTVSIPITRVVDAVVRSAVSDDATSRSRRRSRRATPGEREDDGS